MHLSKLLVININLVLSLLNISLLNYIHLLSNSIILTIDVI